MGYLFKYDKGVHKHHIYALEVKNEKEELIGYRPLVHAIYGRSMKEVSNLYPNELAFKVFSDEKNCRNFAIDFFQKLQAKI